MRTLVTHDMPMIDENGTVHDALVILIPFLILQPQNDLLEDLENVESSLNSCKKKKKTVHCSHCNEPGHNRATCNNPLS